MKQSVTTKRSHLSDYHILSWGSSGHQKRKAIGQVNLRCREVGFTRAERSLVQVEISLALYRGSHEPESVGMKSLCPVAASPANSTCRTDPK